MIPRGHGGEGQPNLTPQEQVARQFYDSFAAGDMDMALAAFADDVEMVDPGLGTVVGLPAVREYLEGFKRAMPDAHAVVSDMFESGHMIIVEGRLPRTHTGPMAGPDGDIPPSARQVDVPFAAFSR